MQCRLGPQEWAAGQVVQLNYREKSWPRGRTVPYQVRLDDGGELIFAPADEEDVVRAYSGKSRMPPIACEPPEEPSRQSGCSGGSGECRNRHWRTMPSSEKIEATFDY